MFRGRNSCRNRRGATVLQRLAEQIARRWLLLPITHDLKFPCDEKRARASRSSASQLTALADESGPGFKICSAHTINQLEMRWGWSESPLGSGKRFFTSVVICVGHAAIGDDP